ncbi:SpoIIE family protein phosphatase [Streptomyces sp. NBS 14/10]|uniref:SpoIIE family protein phosphatase n=1 Tax=Streptomyces sp. NBS 14/10 TaxID=1945643 RepID=UPI000B7D073B|nr:SpoIIE family protein phosphatase [Streptomyces sp. NBS 14/10]KAK1177460.1 SpoIIE family protein phosphatase [Streptomyces sp. NBS 14/10]
MFILQLLLVLLLVVGAVVGLALQARSQGMTDARRRSLAVAGTMANAPGVAQAMASNHPTALLRDSAEAARKGSGVDSVVVFDRRGLRLTHPDTTLIGKRIIGPAKLVREELAGKTISETFHASQGLSVVSAVPVLKPDGSVLGGVSVGVKVESVNSVMTQRLPLLLGSATGALALTTGGTALISRRVRRQTHGLGATEMTRMYEHHDAVLHSVREGVLVLAADGRLLLVNSEARALLGLAPDAEGRHIAELGLEPQLTELLVSGRSVTDEVYPCGNRLLAVNLRPTDRSGGPAGSVATLRDTTELQALSGRAAAARERLELLYDAGVRIGSTLELTETTEKLVEVAVPRFADIVTVELLDPVLQGEEPEPPYEVLHRTAMGGEGSEGGDTTAHPLFRPGERAVYRPTAPQSQALRTGHAVLQAAVSDQTAGDDQTAGGDATGLGAHAEHGPDHGVQSLITVPLRYRGVTLGLANFWRTRRSEPFEEEDLAIAGELSGRTAICVDNARRYAREHAMVTTLQRNLLPGSLPEQDATEVATRYLPAQGGTSGSWFDVIPLPGHRVALVVGKVAGQGLHAAATMGRLRIAVQNFSALDLPPDELLSLLDELVARLDLEQDTDPDGARITGATCLYAIYDSVRGLCTVARAGHPAPVLIGPDGTVHTPAVPVSPPLGLGGEPFEVAELPLAEGTRLVLYTNGLLDGHDGAPDTGLDPLRRALADSPDLGPEETCQTLLDTVRPARQSDDIALLVARTRVLDPKDVAEWEVPLDPAAVAPIRAAAAQQIRSWGLEEADFAAELIISELITNALRYGAPPVRLRLLRGRDLTFEVSDGSSTSPHLRRARATDEGGRGLFLVSQFAQRWGTRYTADGKVIWAEQALGGTAALDDGALGLALGLGDSLVDQGDPSAL